MARVRCKIAGHKVMRRGEATVEWYKDGLSQYYCYGYIDSMTDEPLPECKECRDYVGKAQDDLEKWNRRVGEQNEIN